MDHQTKVLTEKTLNFQALMPTGLVYPKINQGPPVSAQNGLEHRQESIGIPLGLSDHTVLARYRVDPTEHIHPFMMLAPRPDHRLLPSFRPYPPKFGMEAKTGFIRKQDQSLPPTSAKAEEFFLTPAETPSPLLPWPEHNGGELPCKLTLPALAKHYGVSLTPVRGAVARLVADAYLEKLPGGRVSVVPVKRRSPKRAIPIAPPPTAPDWHRLLIREVMLASLRHEPVPLREEALSRKHRVGRSVIRQSLGRLAGAGPIEHIPPRGWRVYPIREDDLTAYLQVREVLELKALELARARIRKADLLPMLESNQAVENGRPALLDNRLHDYLIEKSGNRYIQIFFKQHTSAYFQRRFFALHYARRHRLTGL